MQQTKEDHRVVLSSLQTRAIIQLLKDTGGGAHPDEVAECADKVMSIPFEPSDSLTLLEALAAYDTERKSLGGEDIGSDHVSMEGGIGFGHASKGDPGRAPAGGRHTKGGGVGSGHSTESPDGKKTPARCGQQHFCPQLLSYVTSGN